MSIGHDTSLTCSRIMHAPMGCLLLFSLSLSLSLSLFFIFFMCKMMGPVLGTKFRFRPDRERPLTISFPEGKKPQQLSSSQREREHRVSRSSSPCCVVLPLQDIMHVIAESIRHIRSIMKR